MSTVVKSRIASECLPYLRAVLLQCSVASALPHICSAFARSWMYSMQLGRSSTAAFSARAAASNCPKRTCQQRVSCNQRNRDLLLWRATLIHFAQAQVVEAAWHERFVQCLCQRSLEVCSSIAWRNQMNQQNRQSPTQASVSQHLDCLSHSTQAPGGRTDSRPSTWRCRWQR